MSRGAASGKHSAGMVGAENPEPWPDPATLNPTKEVTLQVHGEPRHQTHPCHQLGGGCTQTEAYRTGSNPMHGWALPGIELTCATSLGEL